MGSETGENKQRGQRGDEWVHRRQQTSEREREWKGGIRKQLKMSENEQREQRADELGQKQAKTSKSRQGADEWVNIRQKTSKGEREQKGGVENK